VNIFVGNLSWGVDDIALREAFEAFGEVEKAQVVHDRETGRSRGFGFVENNKNREPIKQKRRTGNFEDKTVTLCI